MMDYRLDRVIQYFREEGMSVGAAGFTSAADAKGPVAGYDPTLNNVDMRKKRYKNYPKQYVSFYRRLQNGKGVYGATNGSAS